MQERRNMAIRPYIERRLEVLDVQISRAVAAWDVVEFTALYACKEFLLDVRGRGVLA